MKHCRLFFYVGFIFLLVVGGVGCTIDLDDSVFGCTDASACNYDAVATDDDGSCTYVDGICETCENGIVVDNDADNDNVCADYDCNDLDSNTISSSDVDADGDGIDVCYDCDDSDASIVLSNVVDNDLDGVSVCYDCDDSDATITASVLTDVDCDQVLTVYDCDDSDASVTASILTDADCDGVLTVYDCDDNDALIVSVNVLDADCDGVETGDDCDDSDASITTLISLDADCDGIETGDDCDDGDASITTLISLDADCDGVETGDDCDDGDASITILISLDADCDGVETGIDCDDFDADIVSTNVLDADCDGVETSIDCDDFDADIVSTNTLDADCDGVETSIDCDDFDADIVSTNVLDADCDGVVTSEDCDDTDADIIYNILTDTDCNGIVDAEDSNTYYPDRLIDITIADYAGSAVIAVNVNVDVNGSAETIGLTPYIEPVSRLDIQSLVMSRFTPFIEKPQIRVEPAVNRLVDKNISFLATDTPPTFNILVDADLNLAEIQTSSLVYEGVSCNVYLQDGYSGVEDYAIAVGQYYDDIIYSNLLTYFALPYDVDGNGKVILYYGDLGSSGVAGYFMANDFYQSISAYTSNEADIVYLNVSQLQALSSSDPDYSDVYHTLAHEIQHLVNYSEKYRYYLETGSADGVLSYYDTWVDEGIAEGAVAYLTNNDADLSYYFSSELSYGDIPDGLGLITWDGVYENYVLTFTFMEYCRIQAGMDSSFYKSLMQNFLDGTDYTLVYALVDEFFDSFDEVLAYYRIANLVNASTGIYGYEGVYSVGTLLAPSVSEPTVQPGGAVYYISSDTATYENFVPANVGDNMYYYRINAD